MIDQYFSPEEWKRFLSTVLVVLGTVIIVALFGFIVVPGLRNANKPKVGPFVPAVQMETGWLDPGEYPAAKAFTVPPVDPATVMAPNDVLLARGKKLFDANCTQCHGATGQGDGPASKGMAPPPRDFTVTGGWKNGHGLTGMFKTLSEGLKGTSMAAYSNLSKKDRMALVHFVQALGKFPHTQDDAAALDALSKGFASAGEQVPPKIPVSAAMGRLVREGTPPAPLGSKSMKTLEDAGARVLARVVADPSRAAQTLGRATSWREGVPALARLVTPGAPHNGFGAVTRTLSADEWMALHGLLTGLVPAGR